MFIAERNLAQSVDWLKIHVAAKPYPGSNSALFERQLEDTLVESVHDPKNQESDLPDNSMDVQRIRGIEDLPRILPMQWILESCCSELFFARLSRRELLMPLWHQDEEAPGDTMAHVSHHELEMTRTRSVRGKLHAYLLLDVSTTMNDIDRRGTVARGLALAFLRKGYYEGTWLNLRPFAGHVGDLTSGIGKESFHRIARRIIELSNCGQTRIQAALETAVEDIYRSGPCLGAAIMLITDGLARLTKNPLTHQKLHTFLLGELEQDSDTFVTLKDWSTTLQRVWPGNYGEILALTDQDSRVLVQELEKRLEPPYHEDKESLAETLQVMEHLRFIIQQWRRALGRQGIVPGELKALEDQLAKAQRLTPLDVAEKAIKAKNTRPKVKSNSELFSFNGNNTGRSSSDDLTIWNLLRRVFLQLRSWVVVNVSGNER
jgi:hypothetical protein